MTHQDDKNFPLTFGMLHHPTMAVRNCSSGPPAAALLELSQREVFTALMCHLVLPAQHRLSIERICNRLKNLFFKWILQPFRALFIVLDQCTMRLTPKLTHRQDTFRRPRPRLLLLLLLERHLRLRRDSPPPLN